MASYTITAVSENVRDWTAQGKYPMKEYRVNLQGDSPSAPEVLNVAWSRKPESPAPTVGQRVEGDLEKNGQYGFKFKQAQNPMGGAPGRFEKQPTHPKDAARMGVGHADEMALTALAVMERLKVLTADQVGSTREFFELVEKTSAWFKRRVDEAGEQAQ